MSHKLPCFIYLIKCVLFVSVLLSLCFLNNLTTAVIFLIAVAVDCSDFFITNKYGLKVIGHINGIVFEIIDRFIVILPLLFSAIWGNLAVWVLFVLLAFEIALFVYRRIETGNIRLRKTRRILYCLYNLVIYFSVICFLIGRFNIGVYSLFVAVVLSSAFIIVSSVSTCLKAFEKKKEDAEKKEPGFEVEVVQRVDGEIVE